MKKPVTPEPPTRWGADMKVMHRITGYTGTVLEVDFEEDLVTVTTTSGHELTWRIENVFEVTS